MDSPDVLRATRVMRGIVSATYPLIIPQELTEAGKRLLRVPPDAAAAHILYMCERTEREYALRSDLGKAFRWLGFVQGWAWADGTCPIATGKETNRPQP